ncbi:phosphoribosylaminoimidazolesuccinocarboxamide synthase, partial [Candidatus Roizmanbacteria bacterium]|nr:phosphoribosylaminoimidazolesuccinocarboxamide synthase [Candidatus Roizmanbacteria bacterium]
MVTDQMIREAIPQALNSVDIPELGEKSQGKVRDIYQQQDSLVLITTDRQSAFDVVLGNIPFKGTVLTQLSRFWFEQTKEIIPNHMLSVPDPNVIIGRKCQGVPVEMVVRGYISGVTNTSIWHSYQKGERTIYGIDFPEGLRKNQKLEKPVITPTTHGGGANGHDERLTREEISKQGIVSEELYAQMEEAALKLFEAGTKICAQNGLILVDTKYEFGINDGKLMLMDEIHTPDSSRFWIGSTYTERFEKGEEPENFDKEFLRLWYAQKNDRSPFARQLVQLMERLGGKYQVDELATKYAFTGRAPLTIPEALAVKQELEKIDELLKQLEEARET